MKKIIKTNAHAFLDYGAALIMIASPWILLFQDGTAAKLTFFCSGGLVLLLSFFTNYEGGVVRTIPMSFHLTMDVLLGLFLILSPWLFGFYSETWLWHVLMGGMSVFAGLFTTHKVPEFLSLKGS
ncbi:SPW repeat domain-containing protein [Sphingobacterium suaedae]|uniref:SPW repeat protein n=1 Tax=Sphingobacterium suaedae TaxID=1686402 RepID=A0ABW5KG19_9SPHI